LCRVGNTLTRASSLASVLQTALDSRGNELPAPRGCSQRGRSRLEIALPLRHQWLSRDGECCGGPCGRDGRPVCLPDLRHRPLTNRECERTEPVLALDAAAGRPGHVRELRHCAAGWPL